VKQNAFNPTEHFPDVLIRYRNGVLPNQATSRIDVMFIVSGGTAIAMFKPNIQPDGPRLMIGAGFLDVDTAV